MTATTLAAARRGGRAPGGVSPTVGTYVPQFAIGGQPGRSPGLTAPVSCKRGLGGKPEARE